MNVFSRPVALVASAWICSLTCVQGRTAENATLRTTLTGHTDLVMAVAFSPDGKTLASAARDKKVILWNVAKGTPLSTLPHSGSVRSLAYSSDGKKLATAGTKLILWDVASAKQSRTFEGHSAVAYSPDGKMLASSGSGGYDINLWDVNSGKQVASLKGPSALVLTIAFSPNGMFLASGGQDGTLHIWEVATTRSVAKVFLGKSTILWSLAFSPDSKTLATAAELRGKKSPQVPVQTVTSQNQGEDKYLMLWDPTTGKLLKSLPAYNSVCVAFSPDGKLLANAAKNKRHQIEFWNLVDGGGFGISGGEHKQYVASVAISPDGKTLASASWDKTIKLWDIPAGK